MLAQLAGTVPEAALDSIQPRGDGSLVFLCHSHFAEKVLRQSGTAGVFYKYHKDSPQAPTTELLWLPEQMSLDEALALAKDSHVLGVAQKGQSKTLALRFNQLYMDVSKNWGTPKWMVYNGKPY